MKKSIHPEYQEVVFQDASADFAFLTRSTMKSKETIKWEDGKEYPLIRVDISSASHPFYTGKQKFVDAAGRVDKFMRKYNWGSAEDTKKKPDDASENTASDDKPPAEKPADEDAPGAAPASPAAKQPSDGS